MAIISIDLPVPSSDGVGAAQDVSSLALNKTIIVSGAFNANASITIEASAASSGDDWVQVAVLRRPDVIHLDIVARRMRVRVEGPRAFSEFSPNVDIAGESGSNNFVQLDVPSENGVGSSTDISALPDFRSIYVSGSFHGNVVIEGSQDDEAWAQIGPSITKPDIINRRLPVKYLRVRRRGIPRTGSDVPNVYMGATQGPAGQDGSGFDHDLVVHYGAVGDGVTDDTQAFVNAIAAIPFRETLWQDEFASRSDHGATIYLPTPPSGGAYRVTQQIEITQRNVAIVAEPGTRIEYEGPGDHAFLIKSSSGVNRAVSFRNIVFHKGGVAIEGNTRGGTYFSNCLFKETTGYAIETLGSSVVTGEIAHCDFADCEGGINVAFDQSDLWVVRRCNFTRMKRTDIVLRSSGWAIEDCDFEQRGTSSLGAKPEEPHIQITNGDVWISNCRFGNEIGSSLGPPRDIIVLGEIDTPEVGAMQPVWIKNCLFKGRGGAGPTATSANCAIKINKAARGLRSLFNDFSNYFSNLVQNAALADGKGAGNVWRSGGGNADRLYVFDDGGLGWDHDLHPDDEPRLQNLLEGTTIVDSSVNWSKSRCTVARNAAGPDGRANTAYTATITASGAPSVMRSVTPTESGWYRMSWRVKRPAGSPHTEVSLGIRQGGIWKMDWQIAMALTDTWETREAVAYLDGGVACECWFYCGSPANTETTGDVLFCELSLAPGARRAPYIENPNVARDELPARSMILGSNVVGYGSAAPSSGRWEVGDLWINSAPIAGGKIGWVCTTAGSPGTWKPFGAIDP